MPDSPSDRRRALLDQLRHLIDEAEMLRQVLPRVPVTLQEGRAREDARSLKETLALLAALDAHVRRPTVEGTSPAPLDTREAVRTAHASSSDALLDALVAARTAFVEAIERQPSTAWDTPVGDAASLDAFLYEVIQEDLQYLRALTLQLFDAQGLGA